MIEKQILYWITNAESDLETAGFLIKENKTLKMKKVNITKRDVVFFVLGLITMLLIETIYDWPNSKKGFIDGWNSANNENAQ